MLIPTTPLVAVGSFGPGLPPSEVARALARGLRAGGLPEPDVYEIEAEQEGTADVRASLDAAGFDARMRRARAVIVAVERLEERTLAGSAAFEIATRARQAGVPAYAVTAENRLDAFDTRILDLQVILEAGTTRALAVAGRKLAKAL